MTGECDRTTLVFGFRYKLHLAGEDCRRTPFSQPAVAGLGTLEGRFSSTPEIGCRSGMTARRAAIEAVFNSVFTRVVNHCVIDVGLKGIFRPSRAGGTEAVLPASIGPDAEMRCRLAKKAFPCNILGRFVGMPPECAHGMESAFVNHAPLKFRLGLSQSVFEGRRYGVLT